MKPETKKNMSDSKTDCKIYHNPKTKEIKWIKIGDPIPAGFGLGRDPETKNNQTGENGPRAILTVFKFINRYTGETFEGNRFEFGAKFNIKNVLIGHLINGKRFSLKDGWRLDGKINLNPVKNIHKHVWFNDSKLQYLLYPDDPKTIGFNLGKL